jgi:hypothetical protein
MSRRRWPVRTAVATTVVAALVATFLLPAAEPVEPLFNRLNGLAFAIVGLLATRRPEGRRIGWLCLAIALSSVSFDLSAGYAETLRTGAVWAYWFGEWVSVVQPVLALVLLPALFPTGTAYSPRWRWLAPVGLTFLAVGVVSVATATDTYEVGGGVLGDNPVGIASFEAVGEWVFVVAALGAFACALAALVSLALRFRRSRGVERLQLRWLVLGLVVLVLLLVITSLVGAVASGGVWDEPVAESVIDGVFGVALLALPLSLGLALTRYRLYDIDRVVSRTVGYTVVVVTLAGAYLGLVVVLGAAARGLTGESGDLVVALSTLAVAGLFQPVRRRVQAAVDHRFNRARYDAQRTVERFAARIRGQVQLDGLRDDLRGVVGATVAPATVRLWLAEREAGR